MAYCWPIRTQNLLNPTLSQGQLNYNGADIYSICTCLPWQKSNEDEKVVSVQVKEFLNAQCFGKLSRSYFVILFQHQTIFCEYVQSGDQETFPLRQRTLTFAMMENEDITSSYITTCVLNAFLSYTAVMLNCLTIYALTKLSSLPRPLKTLPQIFTFQAVNIKLANIWLSLFILQSTSIIKSEFL